jgi:hypothetical protein
MGGKFYAVRVGRRPGVYTDWSDVKPLVNGFPGAQHKSFRTRSEAERYLAANPTAAVGSKRARDDTYSDEDDVPPFRAQITRQSAFEADRRAAVPIVTSGVLIAVTAHAPPPRPFGGSSGGQAPLRTSGYSTGGRSRFDPVVEGPLRPILSGSVYELVS